MKQNIENYIVKARKATGMLYSLLKKNSAVPLKSKITLYRSYIRPPSVRKCSKTSQSYRLHKTKVYVWFSPYRTQSHLLHKRTNIPAIKDFIAKLTKSFYRHSARSENKLTIGRVLISLPFSSPSTSFGVHHFDGSLFLELS